jgi:hypothetical protein
MRLSYIWIVSVTQLVINQYKLGQSILYLFLLHVSAFYQVIIR